MKFTQKNLSKTVLLTLFTVACLASLSLRLYSQKTMDISGYLVDANGKPLQNGMVTIFYDPPLPTASFERITEVWKPFDDGLFGMQVPWRPGRKIMVLTEDRPDGFYPIEDENVLTNKKIFKGVVIYKFAKSRDLQKVRDYIKYGQAVLDIGNCSASFVEKILKHQIFLKVRSSDKKVVANTSFRPAYIKESESLIFNLPEGTWYLELIDTSAGQVIMPSTRIAIESKKAVKVPLKKGV